MKDLRVTLDRLSKLIPAQSGVPISPRTWLEFLGTELGCDWATYWKVDHRTHLLYPAAIWHSTKVQAAGLEKATDQPRSMGEGNAGLVWRSQKPIWTTDLVREMCVPRSHNALAAGLSAGVWFALKTDQAIFGVLEFLGNDFPEKTPELMSAVENLGILIGRQLAEKPRVSKR